MGEIVSPQVGDIKQMEENIDDILDESEIIEEHLHPPSVVTDPSGAHRYGGITFTAIADGNRVRVAGSATIDYYWYNAPGAPGANQVYITRQGVLKDDVLLLCKAVRGEVDANIQYGAGVGANADVSARWTSQRFSIGTVAHAAGQSAVFIDNVMDQSDTVQTITLTSTATVGTLTTMTRVWSTRYSIPGGGVNVNNRIAGPMQTIMPIGSVPGSVEFDPSIVVVEAISTANTVYEVDLYYSMDEVTFTEMEHGLNISMNSTAAGSQQYICQMARPPVGSGIFCKMRTNSGNNETVDFKLQVHVYSPGV